MNIDSPWEDNGINLTYLPLSIYALKLIGLSGFLITMLHMHKCTMYTQTIYVIVTYIMFYKIY